MSDSWQLLNPEDDPCLLQSVNVLPSPILLHSSIYASLSLPLITMSDPITLYSSPTLGQHLEIQNVTAMRLPETSSETVAIFAGTC